MNFKELYQPVHTIIGEGCINEIPRHVDHFGGTKALTVTDEGLVKIGTVKMVTDVLDRAGRGLRCFFGCEAESDRIHCQSGKGGL